MRAIPFTLMLMASTAAVCATVYKWVDEQGITHYSDQPHENAAKVEVKEAPTYKAPPAPRVPAAGAEPRPQQSLYQACAVSQPTNDQTFTNTFEVAVSVNVQPMPRDGDQLVVTLDGQRIGNFPVGGGQFTISPIERGTHSVQATIQDPGGKTVCQSPAVTFHVLQPSTLNPNNPNRARH